MLHLPPDKTRSYNEQSAQSVKEHTAEYKIDNRSVYDILDQICNDVDLYHMSNRISSRGMEKGIICHPFQVVRPKPCYCDSIRSQDGTPDVYV